MLEEIRISSLGVIDSSTLELGPGLTVITGETGAGKTMVVTALGLLLGGRADSGAVRSGAKHARVEGVVVGRSLADFRAAVEEAGGEVEDDRVVLARNVAAAGPLARLGRRRRGAGVRRSRARRAAGGGARAVRPAPVAQVRRPARVAGPVRRCRAGQDRGGVRRPGGPSSAQTERTWPRSSAPRAERAREADLLRFGLGEIEAVDPRPGEDAALAVGGDPARVRRHPAHRRRAGTRGALQRRRCRGRAGHDQRRAPGARRRARARRHGR